MTKTGRSLAQETDLRPAAPPPHPSRQWSERPAVSLGAAAPERGLGTLVQSSQRTRIDPPADRIVHLIGFPQT